MPSLSAASADSSMPSKLFRLRSGSCYARHAETSPGRQRRSKQESWTHPVTPLIDETSLRYEGWRIVVVCFLLATFGWGLGFYGQSVYVAELHRLHGWPASLISSGTTFFYLFGAVLVVFRQRSDPQVFGPRNCLIAGMLAMAAAAVAIGQVHEPWQLYRGQRRARLRLGRHQPRHHHQHARPLVRQEARHGDQPGAERREFRRHRRRAAAGGWRSAISASPAR